MNAAELINYLIPPLKLTDDGNKAIIWMEELRTNQLPVVEKGKFLGFISEEVILENNDATRPISEYDLFAEDCFIFEDQHFYDVIKMAHEHEVQLVSIIGRNGNFLGVVTIEDTISSFAQSMAVQEPGAILIVSMNYRDYSLAEISRIVEGENAKILSSCVTNDYMDASRIKLTLKVNKPDISHISASIERFGYKVIGKFQEIEIKSNDQDRYDMLMKYLNI